jgi:hypothetical protein
MNLGLTQLLTEMTVRNTSGGKGGRCLRLEIWEPKLPGNVGVCPGLYRDGFTFTFNSTKKYMSITCPRARNY